MGSYALFLAGWDEMSIVGYDDQTRSCFAQLWRNGTPSSAPPDAWLNTSTPHDLDYAIVKATGAPPAEVEAALRNAWAAHSPTG